jgi:REP element-mobilizing transposase RayT
VRRAFLCGRDKENSRNFDHRRKWIEDRILHLGDVFAVAIYGYAVMSNHYHVVVKVDPQQVALWSDEVVADKWLKLCPGSRHNSADQKMQSGRRSALLADPQRIKVLRSHLGSLSWFMRFINEPLARMANEEDKVTGRFWEGRFKSQVLLDDAALIACMAYVDLNPVRAGIAQQLSDATHTAVKHRMNQHDLQLPLEPVACGINNEQPFPILLENYLSLVRSTAEVQKGFRRGLSPNLDILLEPCGLDHKTFLSYYSKQHSHWQRALGSIEQLKVYLGALGLRHFRTTRKKHNVLAPV